MSHGQLSLAEYFVAGGTAGTVEVLCLYPLDVLKSRMMLNTGKSVSALSMVRDIVREEGFGRLYRGLLSPVMAEAPKRALKFSSNEQYKKLLRGSDGSLSHVGAASSGALAGMTEALVNCPFEVIKVRMQAKENLALYKSTGHALVSTVRTEGVMAVYKGLEAQMWRNGVWNGTYFAIIPTVKRWLGENYPADSKGGLLSQNFAAGVVGGTVATTLNTPFDVVKTRMQNVGGSALYRWTLPSVARIAASEGIRALYKGFGVKIARLAPGGGLMIIIFDAVVGWMHSARDAIDEKSERH